MRRGIVAFAVAWTAAVVCGSESWPVLKTYEGECLRRVKMPLGGIGTGTISLAGRGSLVDWEIENRPNKGYVPTGMKGPHFAVRCATASGLKAARLLEGPLQPEEYEGEIGCAVPNQGFPRFARATFRAAYPLAQIDLSDPGFPLSPHLEAFNPLVPGDAAASGIPAALFRWTVRNTTAEVMDVSLVGSIVRNPGVTIRVPDGVGAVTRATDVREPGWNVAVDRYWRKLVAEGCVADTPKDDSTARRDVRANVLCVSFRLAPGESKAVPFVIAWRFPDRKAWGLYDSKDPKDVVGNWYATRYATADAAADDLLVRLPELEGKTVAFVRSVLSAPVPDVIKEAALFNLSTLRTETCFRTADGHFYGWEGCYDKKGSCWGNCTHVWGYEHALVDLWPDLARDMLDLEFGPMLDGKTGHMTFRIGLPLEHARSRGTNAAADGQMQCIVKACEYWRKSGDGAWLKARWPSIRKALSFCWIEGGWDADRDGVMEGCQHNTMDVEYYGPNPQMEFLYLAALAAAEAMATACDDAAFAADCRALRARGSAWTEAHLFNGAYYEHEIRPPKGKVADGLRHPSMGAKDLTDPDYQLGKGCLIDQLLGDYAARAAGLGPVADAEHAKTTLRTILERCRKAPDDATFNPMRGYALYGETSLRMAWYPDGQMPRSPFPYYTETMTGFEYVVAALLAWNDETAAAEKVVRDIRARYDGIRRNPFDEAECGHHYARALAAWTVYKAFVR